MFPCCTLLVSLTTLPWLKLYHPHVTVLPVLPVTTCVYL